MTQQDINIKKDGETVVGIQSKPDRVTEFVKVSEDGLHDEDAAVLARAGEILRNGGLVAFPTETVYGLGASIYSDSALHGIFAAKGRPSDNPLIAHISSMSELSRLVSEIPENALKLAEKFWPGPMTLVMKKRSDISDVVTAGLDTVAVRMPKNETARALIASAGVAIAAPSANTSGKPSPTKAVHVLNDMDGHIDMIIDGGSCAVGIESTVIDVTHGAPVILRPGGITSEMIKEALGCEAGNGYTHIANNEAPRAPGMKYRHYAPNARLYIAKTDSEEEKLTAPERIKERAKASAAAGKKVAIIVTEQDKAIFEGRFDCICAGSEERPETIAQTIFDIFRQADAESYDELYMRSIDHRGIGEGVMNRIMKAAAGVI